VLSETGKSGLAKVYTLNPEPGILKMPAVHFGGSISVKRDFLLVAGEPQEKLLLANFARG
jgi:hypothetical protein